jgi:glyoxylase-like metal-dependent hydrolase (beta-lactamase superfamily II)
MCLYESRRKILLSGDHILSDITPNIQLWSDNGNPLKDYLSSLDKVRDMDVEMVLPGHRRVFRNCRARIDELKDHHARRAQEVLTILAQAPATAFEVASRMSWDIDCESWEQFPVAQKWFATGEAIAHLKYLEEQGQVCRRGDQNRVVYSRA